MENSFIRLIVSGIIASLCSAVLLFLHVPDFLVGWVFCMVYMYANCYLSKRVMRYIPKDEVDYIDKYLEENSKKKL